MQLRSLEKRLRVWGQASSQNDKKVRKICWVKWENRADQLMPEETPQFQKSHHAKKFVIKLIYC